MKKRLTSLSVLFVLTSLSFVMGQIIIQPKTYSTSIFNLNDIWSQVLINNGASTNVVLEGFIVQNSEEIISISSQEISVQNGLTSLSQNDIFVNNRWVKSNYPYYNFVNLTNTLPFGDFEICLRILDAQTLVELTRTCAFTTISPSSPPVLISPANQEEIYSSLPTFSWFPPSPILPDMDIAYDIKIVEVYAGQTAEDAIQINPPIVIQNDIPVSFFSYNVGHTALKYDTYYAWQVNAKNNVVIADASGIFKDVIAQSEVFKFILRPLPVPDPDECYHAVDELINPSPVTINKKLRILFFNNDNMTGNLDYELTDSSNNVINLNETYSVSNGTNKFIFDLTSVSTIQTNSTYTFTIKGSGNKEYYFKFKYSN